MKHRLVIALLCGVAVAALAGPIKTWQAGEVITAQDLNASLQHIHNLMVGGHGARLVNADVNPSANIAHSKLATPQLLPKFVGIVSPACTSGTCTLTNYAGISSVTYSAPGSYTVFFSSPRLNAVYAPFIQSLTGDVACAVTSRSTTSFQLLCRSDASVNTNAAFSIMVLDDNP